MNEAAPMSIEPPPPSAERLAAWRALIDRIRQGDRAQTLTWDEVAAARPAATYEVLVTQQVHRQLLLNQAEGASPAGWSRAR
jgi:hypothetical protein